MNLKAAASFIKEKLEIELPAELTYHNLEHTLDVTNAALILAHEEGITDQHSLDLLATAALFHDLGFITAYDGHEAAGCILAKAKLPTLEYSSSEIDQICEMIMATRMPQSPKNHLEQILCDADLDYLGREDYPKIAQNLFQEWMLTKRIDDPAQWNRIQFDFLRNHHYWTATSKKKRDHMKLENQEKLKASSI
ncbi:hypothetical protein BH11BAC2_BH11BAC2_22760 [soil metagenome]